jgi:outer membrane protein OmpA-like peptidoglycan-associated protein
MDHQEEKLATVPGTTVERVEDGVLLLKFDSDVLFDTGSAMLSPSASATLDQATEIFLEYRKTAILAQGFTDSVGGEEYNYQLSVRRAQSVMNHLIGRGLAPDRITAVGYGEGYPVASNDTPEGRQQNRRVNLLLKAKAR